MLADTISAASLGLVALIGYIVMLWVALAFYVVRDARRRSPGAGFQLIATLLGFFPPFFGAIVYLVIRPTHTLEEERAMALEEQALIDPEAEQRQPRPCPSCGRDIEADFVLCPYCRTQFARRCTNCARSLRLGWSVCPYCADEVGLQPLTRSPHAAERGR